MVVAVMHKYAERPPRNKPHRRLIVNAEEKKALSDFLQNPYLPQPMKYAHLHLCTLAQRALPLARQVHRQYGSPYSTSPCSTEKHSAHGGRGRPLPAPGGDDEMKGASRNRSSRLDDPT